jgi:hypothetical protein
MSSDDCPVTSAHEPKRLDQFLRDLQAAKQEQRRRDASLAFEEKVEIVLELQEASRLMRAGRRRTED